MGLIQRNQAQAPVSFSKDEHPSALLMDTDGITLTLVCTWTFLTRTPWGIGNLLCLFVSVCFLRKTASQQVLKIDGKCHKKDQA